jgi:hypothetical protein
MAAVTIAVMRSIDEESPEQYERLFKDINQGMDGARGINLAWITRRTVLGRIFMSFYLHTVLEAHQLTLLCSIPEPSCRHKV